MLCFGYWPEQVDHINGNKSDNRLENLRNVNNTENQRNTKIRRNNKSGNVGVSWNEIQNRWHARINVNKISLFLGVFYHKDDAIKARKDAEIKYGFHPNHGRQ